MYENVQPGTDSNMNTVRRNRLIFTGQKRLCTLICKWVLSTVKKYDMVIRTSYQMKTAANKFDKLVHIYVQQLLEGGR